MSSLYQLVRDTLDEYGGTCSRQQLLAAILADPVAGDRLARGQGFPRLLQNMKYSGFIEIEGQTVRRTNRRVGRRRT